MTLILVVLFVSALAGGTSVLFLKTEPKNIRFPLIFAGAYLFSITIVHILPEVFTQSSNPIRIGLFVLLGFFLQQVLEYFTSGIEHGHFHADHALSKSSKVGLLIALMIHATMEGGLLTHESPFHGQNESYSLLLGIVLHKIPAAFALMATLKGSKKMDWGLWAILLIFSLASPLGLLWSRQIFEMSPDHLLGLFALVSGSFLHISTTIFVESSPNHHFGWTKLAVSLAGASLAIITEFLL